MGVSIRGGSVRRVGAFSAAAALTLTAVGFASTPAGATWSGHNGRIAFERLTETEIQIWTMHGVTNGTGVKLTTQGNNTSPSYSPNGSVIAFDSDRVGGVPQIFLMGAGGGQQRNISPDGKCSVYPSFSPDGLRVVYVRYPDTTCTGAPDLWAVKRNGTGAVQLTSTPTDRELTPSYSPDGQKIVFASHTATPGTFAVYTINANGTGRRRISQKYLDASFPDWSPDGTRIVFASNADQPDSNIYISDGTLPVTRVLPKPVGYDNSVPKWSPDGKQILFASSKLSENLDLFSVRLANGAVRRRGTASPRTTEFLSSWQALP